MKISVSLLDGLVKEADAVARKLRVSRSTLIQTALREFLTRGRDEKVTAALNRSLAKHPHEIDPFLQQLVIEAMKRIEWKE
jgi:metal-responsive CopG/Arc/MetJ family transcriptional regulator